jgi:hypothetical protein
MEKIILKGITQDQTRELRPIFNSGDDIEFSGEAETHGMLKEDLEALYGRYHIGDIGAAKIFRITNVDGKYINGGKFFNSTPTFSEDNPRPDRDRHNVAENVFLQFYESQNISIKDLEFTSYHTEMRNGYPAFYGSREFEHAFETVASKNIYLKNIVVNNIPGDFLYLRREILPRNSGITIIDCTVTSNGRQGVAWGDGENVYIDNLTVKASGRGGVDIETVREQYAGKNIIVKNSYFNTWLLTFPMGGLGTIENALFENNTSETNSNFTAVLGDRQSVIRKNIIFRGNKSVRYFGSPAAMYTLRGAENILIENEETKISSTRSGIIADINNCRNVVIRNNRWEGAKIIKVIDTPLEEIKIYGNNSPLKLQVYSFEMPFIEAPNIWEIRKDITDPGDAYDEWGKQHREYDAYMEERWKTATSEIIDAPIYDVEKYGEPDVPKDPDFAPYMGVDTVEEEPEVIEPTPEPKPIPEPTPKPEEPPFIEPIKKLTLMEKILNHLKEYNRYYIIGFLIAILLIIIL